ncbi:MAG: 2-oxoglutarate dehydrogenase E1 component, partial [Cryomorphaceae bacterium]
GWTSKRKSDSGINVFINLAPNPSHLESVGPVVQGITRAKQDKYHKENIENVLPVIIHGDAAIAGQGVVYEVVQMERLKGFKTGGTIHIVVNNQIGFTTNYADGRSSTYCTDVGKANLCPILHVNADDAEAVVHASNFAIDYRMRYKRDVFIDLLGYRKYGHNEGDEPRFTQPKLYKSISNHPSVKDIYAQKLISENIISDTELKKMERDYANELDSDLVDSKKEKNAIITPFMEHEWKGFKSVKKSDMMKKVKTCVTKKDLDEVSESLFELNSPDQYLRKISKLMSDRKTMYFIEDKVDWAIAETLAYGTVLKEGYNVRISGQDVERGTFSHRHAILKKEKSEDEYVPLNNISEDQGTFEIYNSSLSEYGVMGYEYGYALASPQTLTIWEAQFGDFSNGAQIMIDQYLSSAEDKWKLQNGLILMLPHGYEGQGAEHSSARLERYLQLCAKDNMFVANCTTPANLFHLLRRQVITKYRKPLVLMTPKSLLRNPKVISSKYDLIDGKFNPVIDDENIESPEKLVFCSGKFFYDLIDFRENNQIKNVAIVRIEQLFPLPIESIKKLINKYDSKDVVWAQEEPRNMGAWGHVLMHLDFAKSFRVASRRFYSSPASGSSVRFKRRHQQVIDYVFDEKKDNFKK